MDHILDQIGKAAEAGLWYVVVSMCLQLPDICSALEDPDGSNEGKVGIRYKGWCDRFITGAGINGRLPYVTANDLYMLRCGVLHQGRLGHPKMQYDRIVFTVPDPNYSQHCNIMGDALFLDADQFARAMFAAYRAWATEAQHDANVVKNLPNLVQLRPKGLPPFIGWACIA